jgi:hypothetical protein
MACLITLFACQAHARTFNYVYAGNNLTQTPYFGRIAHLRNLTLTVSSPTELPANTCSDLPLTSLTALSDGRDTLASLAASGFVIETVSWISLCAGVTGNDIVSWVVGLGFTGTRQHHDKNALYTAGTQSAMTQRMPWFDLVVWQHGLGYKTKDRWDWNTTAPGTWQVQAVDK